MSRTAGGFRKGLGMARSLGMDWAIHSNSDRTPEPELAGNRRLLEQLQPRPLRPPLALPPSPKEQ